MTITEDDFTGLWVSKKDPFSILLVLGNSPSPYTTRGGFISRSEASIEGVTYMMPSLKTGWVDTLKQHFRRA